MYDSDPQSQLEHRVSTALKELKKVLHSTRRPSFADNVPHTYEDKYMLAEFLTSSNVAATLNCLDALGLTSEGLASLAAAARDGRVVTLRLKASERCEFLREVSREVQSARKDVAESTLFGKIERSVVTKITEYFWKFEVEYEFIGFVGVEPGAAGGASVPLRGRKAHCQIMTTSREQPKPSLRELPPMNVDVSWLLRHTSEDGQITFRIDRDAKACKTPRRNAQVDEAMQATHELESWCNRAVHYLEKTIAIVQPTSVSGADGGKGHGLDLQSISRAANGVFCPVLPLFVGESQPAEAAPAEEEGATAAASGELPSAMRVGELLVTPAEEGDAANGAAAGGAADEAVGGAAVGGGDAGAATDTLALATPSLGEGSSAMVRVGELNAILGEQRRSLAAQIGALGRTFPAPSMETLVSVDEAASILVLKHATAVGRSFVAGIEHVEGMLRNQLVAAIGKQLTPSDFTQYMRFHDARAYLPAYAPQPFCFAVRRPGMYPEGTVAIEEVGGESDPIYTFCKQVDGPPMTFRLSAATSVEFTGERYLHGYIAHEFSETAGLRRAGQTSSLQLTARARQFSSFLMLLGRIGPNHSFQPQHAMVVQNKDELNLPLHLEQLPTAKEFRDAIESLSPEQQRFATAYRSLQLEGSIFAVLVVQLKPQLEALLQLPVGSLTKEIGLTQRLMELFMTYQIPSDLLSFDGDEGAPPADKLAAVKGHVEAINKVLDEAKSGEIEQARQRHAYAHPGHQAFGGEEEQAEEEHEMFGCFAAAEFGAAMDAEPRSRCCRKAGKGSARAPGGSMMFGGRPPPPPASAQMMAPPPPPPPPPCPTSAAPLSMKAATASAAPVPSAQPSQPAQPLRPTQPSADEWEDASLSGGAAVDFTKVPSALDALYATHDVDNALRPTLLKTGERWVKRSQRALLGTPSTSTLFPAEQKKETQAAFDLLDALSRSGSLPLQHTALHVVVAATHCFDASLVDTVVTRNVNPIEKLERSSLLVASTVHAVEPRALIQPSHYARVATFSAPALLPPPAPPA